MYLPVFPNGTFSFETKIRFVSKVSHGQVRLRHWKWGRSKERKYDTILKDISLESDWKRSFNKRLSQVQPLTVNLDVFFQECCCVATWL